MRQLLIAVSFLAAIPAAAAPLRLASYEFDPSVDGLPAISAALTRATPAADAEANWIVQLEGPVSPAARADVTAAAEILGYLPAEALVNAGRRFLAESAPRFREDKLRYITLALQNLQLSSIMPFDLNRQVLDYHFEIDLDHV